MTLLERRPADTPRDRTPLIIETERLRLRAPALEDVKAIATLVNDRRIAENTARIPHPYTQTDAEEFITSVTASEEAVFTVALARGRLIGMCGLERNRRGETEIGYWLGAAHGGQGYAPKRCGP
jgi:RimJ/RimL family protein N-acetyltransferase